MFSQNIAKGSFHAISSYPIACRCFYLYNTKIIKLHNDSITFHIFTFNG